MNSKYAGNPPPQIKSNHLTKYKHSAYYLYFMLNRLNNIPMDTNDYNNELNTIKYIPKKINKTQK